MGIREKYSSLSKNTILFTINSFGSKMISFLFIPLYTTVLHTSDYGIVDLLSTTVQLLIPVMTLNIQDAVIRFALDDRYNPEDVVSGGMKVIGMSSLFLAIALTLLRVTGAVNLENRYLIFLFLSFIVGAVNNSISMYLRARDRVRIIVIGGLVNTVLTCFLNIFLLLFLKMGINGYLLANVIGGIISIIIMAVMGNVINQSHLGIDFDILSVMIPYSLPLVVNSLAWWFNNASDRYILVYFAGSAVNGIYAVSYKIPTVLSTIQNIFYNAWSVSAVKEFDEDDTDGFIGNVYLMYSCVSFVGCSFILLFHIPLARLLYAKDFFVAWKYVPPLLVGTVFNGLALFEGCIFTAVKRTRDVSMTTFIGAVINTVFNFILIPFWGALGAAIATMAGYFFIWIIRTVRVRSIVKMKVKWIDQILACLLIIVQGVIALSENMIMLQIVFFMIMILCQWRSLREIVYSMLRRMGKNL